VGIRSATLLGGLISLAKRVQADTECTPSLLMM